MLKARRSGLAEDHPGEVKLKRCDRVRKLSRLPNVISDLALRTGMDIEVSFAQASIRSRPGEIRVVTREQVLVP
ncbi:hypothetical protein [Paenibacillus sp. Y412MC10]|uniref:hypothetical protein n=1 Tax=Geobacillus sp. (strain Y412MC10) TaxID=481743 RepID=UPI0011A12FCA|nr:hypothetical protein [Paenibacillus sp. Y412MC10]